MKTMSAVTWMILAFGVLIPLLVMGTAYVLAKAAQRRQDAELDEEMRILTAEARLRNWID